MTDTKRRRRQIILLFFLSIIYIISVILIYMAATIFRNQSPFFRLWDGNPASTFAFGDKPAPNPGVDSFEISDSTALYFVLGSDERAEAGFRTDVLLLVALDRVTGRVSLVSFPRDLWVDIPGHGQQRINTVVQTGGFELLADTLQVNFGIYPTKFAMVNMAGFLDVVDILGDIEIETELTTADSCDSSLDPDGWCEVGPGTVELDSAWVLWYVRARYNSSDFDRMRRTQEVALGIFKKVVSFGGMSNSPELLQVYSEDVDTNIMTEEIFGLLQFMMGFNQVDDMKRFKIGPEVTSNYTTDQGAAVLLPDVDAIQAILRDAMTWVSP